MAGYRSTALLFHSSTHHAYFFHIEVDVVFLSAEFFKVLGHTLQTNSLTFPGRLSLSTVLLYTANFAPRVISLAAQP